jgi:hypothetical protein
MLIIGDAAIQHHCPSYKIRSLEIIIERGQVTYLKEFFNISTSGIYNSLTDSYTFTLKYGLDLTLYITEPGDLLYNLLEESFANRTEFKYASPPTLYALEYIKTKELFFNHRQWLHTINGLRTIFDNFISKDMLCRDKIVQEIQSKMNEYSEFTERLRYLKDSKYKTLRPFTQYSLRDLLNIFAKYKTNTYYKACYGRAGEQVSVPTWFHYSHTEKLAAIQEYTYALVITQHLLPIINQGGSDIIREPKEKFIEALMLLNATVQEVKINLFILKNSEEIIDKMNLEYPTIFYNFEKSKLKNLKIYH